MWHVTGLSERSSLHTQTSWHGIDLCVMVEPILREEEVICPEEFCYMNTFFSISLTSLWMRLNLGPEISISYLSKKQVYSKGKENWRAGHHRLKDSCSLRFWKVLKNSPLPVGMWDIIIFILHILATLNIKGLTQGLVKSNLCSLSKNNRHLLLQRFFL